MMFLVRAVLMSDEGCPRTLILFATVQELRSTSGRNLSAETPRSPKCMLLCLSEGKALRFVQTGNIRTINLRSKSVA